MMAKNYEDTIRHRHIILLILIGVFVLSVVSVTISILIIAPGLKEKEYSGRQNILFIVVDDLRPTLGCYGDARAITPNIDQLASKSVLFKNAFAQQALCGPSRTSFLTSRRPDSLHLYDVHSYWRDAVGNFSTLPEHFKFHGYESISIGKVFHPGIVSNKTDDYPRSWTEYPYHPPTQKYKMSPVCPSLNGTRMNLVCPVDVKEQPLGSLPDIQIADYAIQYLQNKSKEANEDKPFFLAVGFNKPHIPFKFPKEYLDLYPIETIDLAPNNSKPFNLPDVAWNPWTDIRERDDVKSLENVTFPYGPLPDSFQKLLRQGYYASLSYMDDQLGRLLNVLEETGFAAHTTIVFIGDHGWSLGEHQEWSKYSNFEVSVRVPLLVHIPKLMEMEKRTPFHYIPVLSQIKSKQTEINKFNFKPKYETEELVELVDLFPTLSAITELPIPPLCRIYSTNFCSEGLSFYSLIKHLVHTPWRDFPWKTAVFSQYPRPSLTPQENSDQPRLEDIQYMGYSIRTTHFRYTEWVEFDNQIFRPNWTVIHARELYDHEKDPNEADNICMKDSIFCDDEYNNTVIELAKKLRKGWRHAMPPTFFDSPVKVSVL